MSVLSFVADDRFIIQIKKALTTNPALEWRNTYELVAIGEGGDTALALAASALVSLENAMHYDVVQFTQVVISTWEPDSVPYDPTAFISLPLSGFGDLASAGGEILALNVCLSVGRRPSNGRFGHIYYRAALAEASVSSPAGDFILTDPSVQETRLSDAVTASGVAELMDGSGPLALAMITATGDNVRPVVGLNIRGVATLPTKHKWFNRTP